MNKKAEYKPATDLKKLLAECKKELLSYECKLPKSTQIAKIREQIKDIERRMERE